MSVQFAIVGEAQADVETASDLADREILDAVRWLDEEQLPLLREWVSNVEGELLSWKHMKRLAAAAGIRVRGHFDGRPGEPDAAAARRAIRFVLHSFPSVDAIVLVRDQDDQPDRKDGLEQARKSATAQLEVVIGFAIVERESWVLAGFVPRDDDEKRRLLDERKHLGFNPCEASHKLSACKDDKAKKNPKRVLSTLCAEDRERERQCWRETSLETLKARGEENGLVAFLNEVRSRLATQFDRADPPPTSPTGATKST